VLGDAIPPVTTATLDTAANAAGWHNTDVTVNLAAVDNPGGSGVRRILYSIDGGPAVSVLGSATSFILTDEGQHTIVFQAMDVVGNYEQPQTIHVRIDKTLPVPVAGGPYFVDEGSTIQLDAAASYDLLSGVASIDWDLDGDGNFNNGNPAEFLGLDGPSTHHFAFQVIDAAGNVANGEADVEVRNVAPEILSLSLSSASINEGQSVTASGTFTDPALGVATETFTGTALWSDGATTPVTISGDTFSTTRSFPDDDPTGTAFDLFAVDITISDDDLGSDTKTSDTVTVNNVAPVITGSINGATAAVPGQPLAYSVAGFTDVGTLDTHTTAWEVRDGSNVVVASGSGLSLNFTPTTPGAFTVKFSLADDDLGVDFETLTLNVAYAGTQVGACGAGTGTALVVGGLTVNDRIHVNPQSNDGTLQVQITNRTKDTLVYQQSFGPPAGGFSQIVIFGQGADDHIQIAGSISIPACVFAGGGNDHVKGGDGADVLVGGDGDDMLIGGGGRDLMIGGYGSDRLVGNTDEDILVAGYTAHDNNDLALSSIMKEWTSAGTNAARIANIQAGTGLTGGYRLNGDDGANQTVFNDNNADTLTGSQGVDWFLANRVADNGGVLDVITDQAANELWSDTDF